MLIPSIILFALALYVSIVVVVTMSIVIASAILIASGKKTSMPAQYMELKVVVCALLWTLFYTSQVWN